MNSRKKNSVSHILANACSVNELTVSLKLFRRSVEMVKHSNLLPRFANFENKLSRFETRIELSNFFRWRRSVTFSIQLDVSQTWNVLQILAVKTNNAVVTSFPFWWILVPPPFGTTSFSKLYYKNPSCLNKQHIWVYYHTAQLMQVMTDSVQHTPYSVSRWLARLSFTPRVEALVWPWD